MPQRPRPRDTVIRRRPRQEQVFELPPPRERDDAPHAGQHAKVFALAFLAMVLLGAALLASPWTSESGDTTPPVDAFLTAVSAGAVTGLVAVDTQEHWNFFGELVILTLIQLGGLGFMVGASLVLQALRGGRTRLADIVFVQHGDPTASLRETGQLIGRIIRFTFVVEAAGALLLTAGFARDRPLPEAAWHGLFHSVSAFCNAGFDLQGGFRSIQEYGNSPLVNVVIMLLIQAGALSYLVLADVVKKRRWERFALDTKLVLVGNLVVLIGGAIVFLTAEWNRSLESVSAPYRPMAAIFQSVAARTAGFATVDFADVHSVTLFAWVGVMLIGGASGSTAGGAKLATVGVVVATVISTLRGREEPSVYGRRLATPLIFRAMAVIVLMVLVHFIATLLLIVFEDIFSNGEFSFISLMFEAMSALATVGLTTGVTPSLSTAGKLVLCAAMFIGRLGPLTAAYALQRRQQHVRYRLPVAPVRIG